MKKEVILALVFLFNLKLVNAQEEITLFGKSYPIILLAPIFFMGLIALFFFGLILKDNIGKLRLPKINLSKIKIKHREIKEIKIDFKTKFDLLKEKAHKIGAQQSFNEFNEILKEFFKEKFNLKHEFAFAELGNLVKGHVKDVELANKISTLKYSGSEINPFQVKLLFKEFENLLKEYKVKPLEEELGFFSRVKTNFSVLFKRKEVKLSFKELKAKAPLKQIQKPLPQPVKVVEKKPSLFTNLFKNLNKLFKKKEIEIKKVEVKPVKPKSKEIKEVIKEQEIVKPVKKIRFVLFSRLINKIHKIKILNMIKHGRNILLKNPALAKRYYGRALLAYYKLPIQEEKEIADKLMEFHNDILYRRTSDKLFLDISKNLIDMKHKGERVSKKSISMLNTLKNFIEREELLASARLKEFSHKLMHEERKLGHFIKKEEHLIGGKIKEDVEKFGTGIGDLASEGKGFLHKEEHKLGRFLEKEKEIFKEDKTKLKHFLHREENKFKKLFEHKEKPIAVEKPVIVYKEEIVERKPSLFKNLKHLFKKEEKLISKSIKKDLGYIETGFKKEEHKFKDFISEEESKLKHFVKKEEHKLGKLLEKKQPVKGIPKQEIAQKTISLIDNYKPRLEFLYKQPKVEIKHEVKEEEPKKLTSRQLRLLQKQRNELYNKLLELEEGKITHDKLN